MSRVDICIYRERRHSIQHDSHHHSSISGTKHLEVIGLALMARHRILKLLRVLIITDLVRQFADYDSYCTFICFFIHEVLDNDGADEELVERCLESIIQ